MERTKVKLSICGSDYFIYTDDDVNYVKELGNKLDERLSKLVHENSRISITQAAILVALEYADSAKKASDSADNLRGQIKEYLEDSARYKMEAEVARRDIERLEREVQSLRAKQSGNKASF
ncbi:MAG: cell division protein ZapA [Acutalibacteraceae bacterium]|jgi:cell division protein ZapA (FtsZ GTPase activity inhibitor)|nr:cell division protein ZapA [Clostridiales bacterium]